RVTVIEARARSLVRSRWPAQPLRSKRGSIGSNYERIPVSHAHANTTAAATLPRSAPPPRQARLSRPIRARFREPLLYPLSYGGLGPEGSAQARPALPRRTRGRRPTEESV